MALGIGYGLPFVAQHGANPYKTQWAAALEGAKGAGATVEDENAGAGSCLVSRGQDVYTDGLPFTPSLLIVPQFYKDGNLYQDVPPFVAEDSTMRFTVSRNTTATRVNSSGLIESVASGVPRIDWLGQSCPGLLVEAAGTNFARWVNQMTAQDTPAASGGMTITTGSTDFLAPDGTSGSITKYVGGAASGNSQYAYYTAAITVTAAGQHTFSLFVKAGATNPLNFCAIGFTAYTGASGTATSYFSLASGTALTSGASIQDYGNGWYRLISAPYTIASGDLTGTVLFALAEGNNDVSFPASGALGLTAYTWGAQLETGAIPTSYIPTTTAVVSRAADVISASGALVSGLIGQTEGTIYAEVDLRNWIASGRILTCSNGTSNERIIIQVGANRTLQAIVTTASADVVDISTASGQVNGVYKCALTYASGDFAFYVNGTQIGTDSSGGVPASTSVFLGKIGTSASTNFLNDRIRAAALYTTRLTDAQLAELTRL
jgi:molybdopterin-binding protein